MIHITLITPETVESLPAGDGHLSGLPAAASALMAAGITDRIMQLGLAIDRIEKPDPVDDPDRIAALGTFNGSIAGAVRTALSAGSFPVLMGGTCSHLPGMIGGLQQALPPQTRLGLLWLDAHGDFNTPRTTRSGMLGGMPVAVVAGLCHPKWRDGAGMSAPLPTNRIMMVDVRNLDPEEEQLIRATDVHIVRLHEPDALRRIAGFASSVDALYVHIDADILDVSLQPNHPTAEPDGLAVHQTLAIVETAIRHGNVVAFGVVSVNPTGADGAISLQSGMDLIAGGLQKWSATRRNV
ncbi:MAG: arginase family protein [Thermomicrobiales bacterium]